MATIAQLAAAAKQKHIEQNAVSSTYQVLVRYEKLHSDSYSITETISIPNAEKSILKTTKGNNFRDAIPGYIKLKSTMNKVLNSDNESQKNTLEKLLLLSSSSNADSSAVSTHVEKEAIIINADHGLGFDERSTEFVEFEKPIVSFEATKNTFLPEFKKAISADEQKAIDFVCKSITGLQQKLIDTCQHHITETHEGDYAPICTPEFIIGIFCTDLVS